MYSRSALGPTSRIEKSLDVFLFTDQNAVPRSFSRSVEDWAAVAPESMATNVLLSPGLVTVSRFVGALVPMPTLPPCAMYSRSALDPTSRIEKSLDGFLLTDQNAVPRSLRRSVEN